MPIVAEHGRRRHLAAQEAHALAIFQVDRGIEDHGGLRMRDAGRARFGMRAT
jgi:hypothetical protein